jgi:hypothetical protein
MHMMLTLFQQLAQLQCDKPAESPLLQFISSAGCEVSMHCHLALQDCIRQCRDRPNEEELTTQKQCEQLLQKPQDLRGYLLVLAQ